MPEKEIIVSEGKTDDRISVHYEILIFEDENTKRLGGVYSKIMDEHYVIFCYGFKEKLMYKFPVGVRDLDMDKKELSNLVSHCSKIFGEKLTKEWDEINFLAKERINNSKKRDILEML